MGWKREIRLNARYGFAGILNGIVGLGSIWGLTSFGVLPLIANITGFTLGLIFSFLFSRKFVFRSKGHISKEVTRFMVSFLLSYAVNVVVLQVCVLSLSLEPLLAQALAVTSYVIAMYIASRFYTFRGQTR